MILYQWTERNGNVHTYSVGDYQKERLKKKTSELTPLPFNVLRDLENAYYSTSCGSVRYLSIYKENLLEQREIVRKYVDDIENDFIKRLKEYLQPDVFYHFVTEAYEYSRGIFRRIIDCVHSDVIYLSEFLEIACEKNDHELVKYLIEIGANVSLNKRCIFFACEYGNYEIIELLVEHGADVNLKLYFDGEDNNTPLAVASRYSTFNVIHFLVSQGIDSDNFTSALKEVIFDVNDRWDIATFLLDNGADVNVIQECTGETCLSQACNSANYEMVQCLCEKYSATPNAYDIWSCVNNKQNIDEYTKIAEFLIRKLDIDYFYNHSDEFSDFFFCSNSDNSRFKIDNGYKKVMDMIVNEQKRRKQENTRSLLLISYKRRLDLHEDVLREISSFF